MPLPPIAPRSAKELAKLMLDDNDYISKIASFVLAEDHKIRQEMVQLFQNFVHDNQVDLRLLDKNDVAKGLQLFYERAHVNGTFVNLLK